MFATLGLSNTLPLGFDVRSRLGASSGLVERTARTWAARQPEHFRLSAHAASSCSINPPESDAEHVS